MPQHRQRKRRRRRRVKQAQEHKNEQDISAVDKRVQQSQSRWGTTCLPSRLLVLCVGFCGAHHASVATAVCKTWQLPPCRQDTLFKHWYIDDFESLTANDPSIAPAGDQTCWKTRYQRRNAVQRNWSTGSVTATVTIANVWMMAMMRGTNLIATYMNDCSVVVFAVSSRRATEVARLLHVDTYSLSALSATATDIFVSNSGDTVQQFTLAHRNKLESTGSYKHPPSSGVLRHAVAEQGVLVTADSKASTFIWDTVTKQLLFQIDALRDGYGSVWDLALDLPGDWCWVAYKNDQIRRISTLTGKICQEKDRTVHFGHMHLGNKGRSLVLAASGSNEPVRIYDAQTLEETCQIAATARTSAVCNNHFLLVSSPGLFEIRSFGDPKQILAQLPNTHFPYRSPSQCDAIRFVTLSSENSLYIYDFSPA